VMKLRNCEAVRGARGGVGDRVAGGGAFSGSGSRKCRVVVPQALLLTSSPEFCKSEGSSALTVPRHRRPGHLAALARHL